jgi:hypothetical protein
MHMLQDARAVRGFFRYNVRRTDEQGISYRDAVSTNNQMSGKLEEVEKNMTSALATVVLETVRLSNHVSYP